MAGTNDFLPFATASGANVVTQSAYAALAAVSTGYQSGVAQSAQLNKTWRQSSIMAAVLAQFIVDVTGANATDDGTTATLEANFIAALRLAGVAVGVDTGTANAYVVNLTPPVAALVDGMVLWFAAKTANSGASTLNVNGLGAKPVVGGAHAALQGGEIAANGKCMVVYSATLSSFVLIECTGAALQVAPATQSQHAMQFGQALGRLVNVQLLTSSGTYVRTPGATQGIVELWGAGAGGSGSVATNSSQISVGVGGGSGAFGRHFFSSLPATQGFTIGSGGSGGAPGGGAGGAGGATLFGALTAPGAPATSIVNPITPPVIYASGAGAAVATGCNLINAAGSSGLHAIGMAVSSFISGGGGASMAGGGGNPVVTANANGVAAPSRGAGGSGGANSSSQPAYAGGGGGNGFIIVWEFA